MSTHISTHLTLVACNVLKLHERQDALGLDYYEDNSHPFLEMTDFLAVIETTVAIIFSQTQPTAVVVA